MSIYFDFEVGPTGRRFRRAVDGDTSDIEAIIEYDYTEKLFGKPDIGALIELSTLSICMINDKKEVIGFMCLCDHPNISSVNPSDWEVWIRNMFQKYFLSRNTLFIHFMCCIESVTDFFLEEAFVSIFRNDNYLLQILLVVPNGCPDDWTSRYQTFKKRNMHKIKSKLCNDFDNYMYLYMAARKEFCAQLKIRRAVEEDNDDIVKILASKCPRFQELYGEFYISEIIGRRPKTDRQIIVADLHHQAVGVMCLNSEINYDMLQKTYEIDPFHGLKKATSLEKDKYKRSNKLLQTFGEPITNGTWSPFEEIKEKNTYFETEKIQTKEKQAKMSHSKVNFVGNTTVQSDGEYKQQHSEDFSERELLRNSNTSLNITQSVVNMLEEEQFDYEIVNIDKGLLTVPEVLSYDFLE